MGMALAAMTVFAQQQPQPPPPRQQQYSAVSRQVATEEKPKWEITTPFSALRAPVAPQPPEKPAVVRVNGENVSTRSWTQTVGWHPAQSAFPSVETQQSTLYIFWIGHEPWH